MQISLHLEYGSFQNKTSKQSAFLGFFYTVRLLQKGETNRTKTCRDRFACTAGNAFIVPFTIKFVYLRQPELKLPNYCALQRTNYYIYNAILV